MSMLETLLSRRSVAAQYLIEPGPSQAEIDGAVDAALRAPDHGHIQPWRFRLISGAARAQFASKLVKATLRRDSSTALTQLDKLRRRAEVPLIIAASAALRAEPKVPEVEQLLAAGAGVMNLLNAFHILGFGAIWLTGANVYDPAVSAVLGLGASERLLGLIYVGTLAANTPVPLPRPKRDGFVSNWADITPL
jgi:nitroreductase